MGQDLGIEPRDYFDFLVHSHTPYLKPHPKASIQREWVTVVQDDSLL